MWMRSVVGDIGNTRWEKPLTSVYGGKDGPLQKAHLSSVRTFELRGWARTFDKGKRKSEAEKTAFAKAQRQSKAWSTGYVKEGGVDRVQDVCKKTDARKVSRSHSWQALNTVLQNLGFIPQAMGSLWSFNLYFRKITQAAMWSIMCNH